MATKLHAFTVDVLSVDASIASVNAAVAAVDTAIVAAFVPVGGAVVSVSDANSVAALRREWLSLKSKLKKLAGHVRSLELDLRDADVAAGELEREVEKLKAELEEKNGGGRRKWWAGVAVAAVVAAGVTLRLSKHR